MENNFYLDKEKSFTLHKMGVTLDSTLEVWARPIIANGLYGEWKRMDRNLLANNIVGYEYVASPNFIELFQVLPKSINSSIDAEIEMPLSLSWCAITQRWYLGWEHAGVDEGWLVSDDSDLVQLAYDAIVYVHTNLIK